MTDEDSSEGSGASHSSDDSAANDALSLLASFFANLALIQILGFLFLIALPAIFLVWVMSWAPGW